MNNLYLPCLVTTEKVSSMNEHSLLRHTVMLYCLRQLLLYENTALTPKPALNCSYQLDLPIILRIIYTLQNSCTFSTEWLLKTGFGMQFLSKWLRNMKFNSSVTHSASLNSYFEARAYICIHTFHFNTSICSIILSYPLFVFNIQLKFTIIQLLPDSAFISSHTFLPIYYFIFETAVVSFDFEFHPLKFYTTL